MGSQDQQANLATSIVNQAQQTVNNYCSISCSQNISNVNITIIGGNATVNITQTCTAIGTECAIKNLVSSEVSNLIKNLVNQSQKNDGVFSLLGPSMNNSTNISNAIKNQVSQLINNTCQQSVNQNINALNIFALNANGTYNIAQTGTMDHASCVLDTVAKLVLTNNVSNDVTQKQTSGCGILGILIAVAIIIVIILLFPIIKGFFGGGGGKVKVQGGPPEASSKEDAETLNRREKRETDLERAITRLTEALDKGNINAKGSGGGNSSTAAQVPSSTRAALSSSGVSNKKLSFSPMNPRGTAGFPTPF